MTESSLWDCEAEELRRIAHVRLYNRISPVVCAAIQGTMIMLVRIGIRNPNYITSGGSNSHGILIGGVATVFFNCNGACRVEFTHQSSSGVMVRLVKNNVYLNEPILWAPGRDPWVITYLIAGYFLIRAAVRELHRQTDVFCEYGNTKKCIRCKLQKSTRRSTYTKPKVRLVPLWDEDDPERANDTSLDLANKFGAQSRKGRLYVPR